MELASDLIQIPSIQLWGKYGEITPGITEVNRELAFQVPTSGATYEAISFDPGTQFRMANLFFDDSQIPVPLIRGDIIKGRFQRVRVAPFPHATWLTGTLTSTLLLPSPVTINNQQMMLRLWKRAPAQSAIVLPDVVQLVQELIVTGFLASGVPASFWYHFHAPGARAITFFVGNHNTTNPIGSLITISPARPEIARTDALSTSLGNSYAKNFVSLTIPAAADSNEPVTFTQVDPGFTEYFYWGGTTTTPGVYTFLFGAIVHFYNT
jgi:hypothetical protein